MAASDIPHAFVHKKDRLTRDREANSLDDLITGPLKDLMSGQTDDIRAYTRRWGWDMQRPRRDTGPEQQEQPEPLRDQQPDREPDRRPPICGHWQDWRQDDLRANYVIAHNDCLFIEVRIRDKSFDGLVDSGASVSLKNKKHADELGLV